MLPIDTTIIRPRRFMLILPFLFLLPFLFFVTGHQETPIPSLVPVIALIFSVGFWLALRKTELAVDNKGLRYKTLFRNRELVWKEVRRTYIKYQHHGKSGSHYWIFETASGTVRFGIGAFSRKNLRLVAEAVVQKCPDAQVEERIRHMAEGRFPWYIF